MHVPHPLIRKRACPAMLVLSDAHFAGLAREIDWTQVARNSSLVLCGKPTFSFARGDLWRRPLRELTLADALAGTSNYGALRLVRHQFEFGGHSAELRKRTGVHFLHRPAAMHFHGRFCDADVKGDLFT